MRMTLKAVEMRRIRKEIMAPTNYIQSFNGLTTNSKNKNILFKSIEEQYIDSFVYVVRFHYKFLVSVISAIVDHRHRLTFDHICSHRYSTIKCEFFFIFRSAFWNWFRQIQTENYFQRSVLCVAKFHHQDEGDIEK